MNLNCTDPEISSIDIANEFTLKSTILKMLKKGKSYFGYEVLSGFWANFPNDFGLHPKIRKRIDVSDSQYPETGN